MTDYRDVHSAGYNHDRSHSTMGSEKSPVAGILIALAVIALVFIGLALLGGTTSTTNLDAPSATAPATTLETAPATDPAKPAAAPTE